MIGYLRGQILEHSEGKLIVATGISESGGVGYQVTVPNSPSYLSFVVGRQVELFIHTHVREDALDLYGFAQRSEKELFLTLLTVNGIGPKGAIGILSKVEPGQLIRAILEGDKESLIQIPGIGKKTAERVVMELGDPMRKRMEAGAFGEMRPASPSSSEKIPDSVQLAIGKQAVIKDAKEALIGLGYREAEVVLMLKRVIEEKSSPKKVEDVIRLALQRMS